MFRRLDPQRANDLRDRRTRYERRARSIRYGTVRAGSVRHLLQAQWRAVTELAQPVRGVAVLSAIGVLCAFLAGLGLRNAWLGAIAGGALVGGVVSIGLVIWARDTVRAKRASPGTPPMVSPPERPARRAPQDS
ncbi:MAG: hypothetical protein ACKV2O_21895 [Acidimicrobiales bacterium]